jgi:hypothetical protein
MEKNGMTLVRRFDAGGPLPVRRAPEAPMLHSLLFRRTDA